MTAQTSLSASGLTNLASGLGRLLLDTKRPIPTYGAIKASLSPATRRVGASRKMLAAGMDLEVLFFM